MADLKQKFIEGDLMHDEPNKENKIARIVVIESLNHGWTVRVGCVSFAVPEDKLDLMITKIGIYLDNPSEIETIYTKTGKY